MLKFASVLMTTVIMLGVAAHAGPNVAAPAPVIVGHHQAGCDRVCHHTVKQWDYDPIVAFNRMIGNVPRQQVLLAQAK